MRRFKAAGGDQLPPWFYTGTEVGVGADAGVIEQRKHEGEMGSANVSGFAVERLVISPNMPSHTDAARSNVRSPNIAKTLRGGRRVRKQVGQVVT